MSSHPPPTPSPETPARRAMTLHRLHDMHTRGEKITMLTAYDASFAALLDRCGVDALLVGDSLGMVLQGHSSTLPVTLEDMVYHTRCVARGKGHAWLIADLPFGSYQEGLPQAVRSATALMQAGAQMVKLEGGDWTTDIVSGLTQRGIPVCAHLGLTPQSVHALGGYRIQGKSQDDAQRLRQQAQALAQAGATMAVLELIPSRLAAEVQSDNPGLLTIGIGAGAATAGQVLVLHDMLGITPARLPRFVRNFMREGGSIEEAIRRYVGAVKNGQFPQEDLHGY